LFHEKKARLEIKIFCRIAWHAPSLDHPHCVMIANNKKRHQFNRDGS
jgi:hypothetical protein